MTLSLMLVQRDVLSSIDFCLFTTTVDAFQNYLDDTKRLVFVFSLLFSMFSKITSTITND